MFILHLKKSFNIVGWISDGSHKYKIISAIMIRRVLYIVGNSLVTSGRQLKCTSVPRRCLMTGVNNRYQFTSTSGPSQTALLEEVEAKIHHVLRSVINPLMTGS
jgi:hypothetical protein